MRNKVACVTVVKNEQNFIREWLAFQIALGFDVVVVFDNMSTDGTKKIVEEFSAKFDVRYHVSEDSGINYQKSVYLRSISDLKDDFDWVAFLDCDEFISLPSGVQLKEILDSSAADAIGINWAFFGSSGHVASPHGLVTQNFLYRSDESFGPNRHVKSIVRPDKVLGYVNAHYFRVEGDYVDLSGNEIVWKEPGVIGSFPNFERGKINHYFVKSREDWERKVSRGYPDLVRKLDEFFAYDRNDVFDDGVLKSMDEIKSIIRVSSDTSRDEQARGELVQGQVGLAVGRSAASTKAEPSFQKKLKKNIALGKKATQSSISEWSNGKTVEEDAINALNGIVDGKGKFHTALENRPWWRVDLGNVYAIDEVRVYNRTEHAAIAARANRILIEASINGKDYIEILRKEDDISFGGFVGKPLVWTSDLPVIARFVRISLLSRQYLHLDQVKIFGDVENVFGAVEESNVLGQPVESMLHVTDAHSSVFRARLSSNDPVSMIITSCGRHDLLAKTLESFFAFNTYKNIKDVIVVEDGHEDPSDICSQFGVKLVRLDGRYGQSYAIDVAYSYVDTEYFIHCEDDWQFYRSGFVEKSLDILSLDKSCVCVWLRSWDDTNGHPLIFKSTAEDFGVLSMNYGEWHGFTWNPSLRRMSDYRRVGPFSREFNKSKTLKEPEVGEIYFKLGYRGVILDRAGYVRHIGWSRHVG